MAGRRLGKGNGRPCAGLLKNGQSCNSRAWKDGRLCLHCSERDAEILALRYANAELDDLVEVTITIPAIDLTYATREELNAIGLYLRATNPRVTMSAAKAA